MRQGSPEASVVAWMRYGRDEFLRSLEGASGLRCRAVRDAQELAERIDDCDVLVLTGGDWSPEVAALVRERAKRLRMIQLVTAGYERLQALGMPAGVVVATAGDSWSPAVAEHALAAMLALFKQLPAAHAAQSRRAWDARSIGPRMRSPHGRTLVIVGYGSIGREAARRARAFGMRVVGVSRSGRKDDLIDEARTTDWLAAALAQADVVLVSVPSSPETVGLIGARQLAVCRPGALLVNVARGNVVDRAALVDALRGGRLTGAAIDVTDPEPLAPDDPLWEVPNLLITPHVSGFSGPDGAERLAATLAANVRRFVAGEAPLHRIDLPEVSCR
jgi:phosphoglycerate dehydrogenase-like enzyme